MVQAYRDHIVHRLNSLQVGIDTTYMDRAVRKVVYLKVRVYIWRTTNRFIADILAVEPGVVTRAPYYGLIEDDLNQGRLYITEIPTGLARPVPAPSPSPTLRAQPSGRSGGRGREGRTPPTGAGGRGGEGEWRRQVENRTQNANLKRAWAVLNTKPGVFSTGSPYRDESLPHGKQIVPADRPDDRRVCFLLMQSSSLLK